MKKITIIFVLLLVMSTLLFADWGAEANWARAINRWLQVTGETSSGTYLSYQQCIDALIDSDGHVNDIYLDNSTITAALMGTMTTATNTGTASDSVSVVEYGFGDWHKTVITIDAHFGAIAGGAELALGLLLYTFPDSVIAVHSTYMGILIDEADGNITADTPDMGIGTTIGSGVHDLLSEVSGSENMLTGQTVASCAGVTTWAAVTTGLASIPSGNKTVYLNIADDWAASGEAAMVVQGIVIIEWTFIRE